MEQLYLDDLHPGQTFISRSHVMDEAEVITFAKAFDPQPFHLDDAAAKDTLFGGIAASGWHTAAVTMRLNVDSGLPIGGGIIGAQGELAWPRPVRPGDELHVESEVLEVVPSKSRPNRGAVTVRCTTLNQQGQAVQVFTAKLIVSRRA
jgi:acyl dehydratase